MTASTTAPSPPGLPILGHLGALARQPLDFLVASVREYGDAVMIRRGRHHTLLLGHPDLVHAALTASSLVRGREADRSRVLVGNGLITSSGETHLRQRRLVQPAFHRQRIAGYTQIMQHITAARTSCWQDGETIDVAAEVRAITLDVVARALFSSPLGTASVAEITRLLADLQRQFKLRILLLPEQVTRIPWLPGNRRYLGASARLHEIITTIIAGYRAANTDHGDLLSMLLLARDDETDQAMTDQQLGAEAITLMLAGYDTTAAALQWTLFLLAQHPATQERLHQELRDAASGSLPRPDALQHLPYLRHVLTESMRLWPPVWLVTRRTTTDLALGDLPVAAGTNIWVSPYVIHRDPRWYADPDSFDPDRWAPDRAAAIPRHAYLPFGGGVHRCIGESFAWTEATVVLAMLCARWRFRLPAGPHPRPVTAAVLAPATLPMTLEAW